MALEEGEGWTLRGVLAEEVEEGVTLSLVLTRIWTLSSRWSVSTPTSALFAI